jgi:hypothetical protein
MINKYFNILCYNPANITDSWGGNMKTGGFLSRKTAKIVFAVAASVLGAVQVPSAYAQQCASPEERRAFDVRAMQSELMVAALSCNKNEEYNRFVSMYKNDLIGAGKGVKGYFTRVYAAKANATMNAFITDLANTTSGVSLGVDLRQYCQKAGYVFNMLLGGRDPFAVAGYFSHLHKMQTCDN